MWSGVTVVSSWISLLSGELFLDGSALFDLSQLLAYRRGEHDPSASLQAVTDGAARDLVGKGGLGARARGDLTVRVVQGVYRL